MRVELGASGSGLRIARADCEAIVDCLYPGRGNLKKGWDDGLAANHWSLFGDVCSIVDLNGTTHVWKKCPSG